MGNGDKAMGQSNANKKPVSHWVCLFDAFFDALDKTNKRNERHAKSALGARRCPKGGDQTHCESAGKEMQAKMQAKICTNRKTPLTGQTAWPVQHAMNAQCTVHSVQHADKHEDN